jgi:hypothetical protein
MLDKICNSVQFLQEARCYSSKTPIKDAVAAMAVHTGRLKGLNAAYSPI